MHNIYRIILLYIRTRYLIEFIVKKIILTYVFLFVKIKKLTIRDFGVGTSILVYLIFYIYTCINRKSNRICHA